MAQYADVHASLPLVVDVDGTLILTDLLMETALAAVGRAPASIVSIPGALARGKARLKAHLAGITRFDPGGLPYDPAVLSLIHQAKADGRAVYLASAANEDLVRAIAEHLGLFDGSFGSTTDLNLAGEAKADLLVAHFGDRGFDYVGNDRADLDVWRRARRCITVRLDKRTGQNLRQFHDDVVDLVERGRKPPDWPRLLRVHQYAKNLLLFVPVITSGSFTLLAFSEALIGVMAFSLCASAVYVLNDAMDLAADRRHPRKKTRPMASGAIPVLQGLASIPLLLFAGLSLASAISLNFAAILVAYLIVTTAYTFLLKKKMFLDVVTLAALYTTRVIAGAIAINVAPSPWLLAFSMLMFSSLALMKRYIELMVCLEGDLPDPSNRNYRRADVAVLMPLAAASGLNAITVFALYISSDAVLELYSRPIVLWLICPLLMYWIGRALIMAHRLLIDDDPIVFALKDRVSRYVLLAIIATVLVAI